MTIQLSPKAFADFEAATAALLAIGQTPESLRVLLFATELVAAAAESDQWDGDPDLDDLIGVLARDGDDCREEKADEIYEASVHFV